MMMALATVVIGAKRRKHVRASSIIVL
jgi:hypothetical protein